MFDDADDPSAWSEFRTYPTASAAEVDAAYLRSEGIQAKVTLHRNLPGHAGRALIWVQRHLHERAAWFLQLPPVSEAELESLATGELPVPEDPGPKDAALPHPATHALDAMAKAPDHHALLLENGGVRVLDTRVRPGERTPVHAHEWPATLYVLSWSDFIRYDPEGKVLLDSRTLAAQPAAGSALWAGPIGPHCVENIGSTDLHILAVEIKGGHA